MFNYSIIFFCACLLMVKAQAQEHIDPNIKEKIIYRVFYQHKHLRDTARPSTIYSQNMVLMLGEKHSQFLSFDKLTEYKHTEQGMFAEFNTGNTNVTLPAGKVNIPAEIILSYTSNTALVNTYIAHFCHYNDSLPEIYWDIQDSTKVIEGIDCLHATTTYLGRKWEVWFSLSLPFPTGPWFLRGLPGVILEAKDAKNEVSYKFLRVESATIPNDIMDYQKDKYQFISLTNKNKSETYSKQGYLEQKALARKDRNAYFRYMSEKYDFNVYGVLLDYGLTNHFSWSDVIPNPINLESN